MKTYNYYQAIKFFERAGLSQDQLEDALDNLMWFDSQAAEYLTADEVEQGLFPIWSEEELRGMIDDGDL